MAATWTTCSRKGCAKRVKQSPNRQTADGRYFHIDCLPKGKDVVSDSPRVEGIRTAKWGDKVPAYTDRDGVVLTKVEAKRRADAHAAKLAERKAARAAAKPKAKGKVKASK